MGLKQKAKVASSEFVSFPEQFIKGLRCKELMRGKFYEATRRRFLGAGLIISSG
jgi:hypothetical protein